MIYRPPAFACDDRDALESFVRHYPFATLITQGTGGPWISHLPLLYENDQLFGHLSRANPQTAALGASDSLAIFHGPHAYVSPRWYDQAPAVPTWNYAVVHALGPARLLNADETGQIMDRMSAVYEPGSEWSLAGLPSDYRAGMLRGIIGFSIAISRLEGKFKLSQNRPLVDQKRVAEQLAHGDAEERLVAEMMANPPPTAP
ncbi:MAG TPA: FMN-binding negative transcriptional regulator [Telmatospirillum sp.]|nr:FMN-binding negative transcriptional regulator [Telmatospirillum sp.]